MLPRTNLPWLCAFIGISLTVMIVKQSHGVRSNLALVTLLNMFNLKLETKGITQEPGPLESVTRVILILMTIKSQIYNLARLGWPAWVRSAMHQISYGLCRLLIGQKVIIPSFDWLKRSVSFQFHASSISHSPEVCLVHVSSHLNPRTRALEN